MPLSFPASVCPECLQRAVSRPDMSAEGVVPGSAVVTCSRCGHSFQLDRFIVVGDRVKVLGRGSYGRVESKLDSVPGVMVRWSDGSAGGYLYSDLSRELPEVGRV